MLATLAIFGRRGQAPMNTCRKIHLKRLHDALKLNQRTEKRVLASVKSAKHTVGNVGVLIVPTGEET